MSIGDDAALCGLPKNFGEAHYRHGAGRDHIGQYLAGTDVGKTFVATSLIRHFRRMGRLVDAIKPVVSGFDPTQAATSDPG
jgi:hypothetical protein